MKEVPNDVVEIIFAVDLNPSNPEQPLNVGDISVKPKGEDGKGGPDWKALAKQLCEAEGICEKDASDDEIVEAIQNRQVKDQGDPEVKKDEKDAFSKANEMDDRPERRSERRPERRPGGGPSGFKKASARALGKEYDDDDEDFGGKRPPFAKKKFDDEEY